MSNSASHKTKSSLNSQLRLMLGEDIAFGPGKADLLDAICETGSISAAGKKMGMSYRRAWMLVDTMNRCFQQPLVDTAKGGAQGGGTTLTPFGIQILEHYRQLEGDVLVITEKYFATFKPLMRKKSLTQ
ncbi:MAG: winged helix-turn-helix domain-containing protein [Pseudomonadota bacterium]